MIVTRTSMDGIVILTRINDEHMIELTIARAVNGAHWPLSPLVVLSTESALALTETLAGLIDAANETPMGWAVADTYTPGGSVH